MSEIKYHGPPGKKKPAIQLDGTDSNVFSIIGLCRQTARKAGWTPEQVSALRADMMSGDYDHALAVALENFEEGGDDEETDDDEEDMENDEEAESDN